MRHNYTLSSRNDNVNILFSFTKTIYVNDVLGWDTQGQERTLLVVRVSDYKHKRGRQAITEQ
jgi:hypothetical protein